MVRPCPTTLSRQTLACDVRNATVPGCVGCAPANLPARPGDCNPAATARGRDVGVTVLRHPGSVVRINPLLDRLPHTAVYLTGATSPAFRAVGVVGFHLAVLTVLGGALLRGLPVSVAVVVALTSAASFFAWALLRRAVTGRERLVLFEHVWFAGAAVAAALWLLRAPILPWLDVLVVALAVFLAAGRFGCAVAGCCHGHPSNVGIRYPEDHPVSRVAGIRVFPVPLIESAGLVAIAVSGIAALPWAAPGAVLVWALAAYAVLRFGMEALRGDPRPHVVGLPVARLAAGIQLLGALAIDTVRGPRPWTWQPAVVAAIGLCAAGLIGLAWYRTRSRPVTAEHVARVRDRVVLARLQATRPATPPAVSSLPGQITVATTVTSDGVHLSVGGPADVEARKRLALAATDGGPMVVGPRAVVHALADAHPAPWRSPGRFTLPPWVAVDHRADAAGYSQTREPK